MLKESVRSMKKLYQAAQKNDATLVQTLLQAQTDPKKRITLAGAALATAAWFGSNETVDVLLACGAKIERKDGSGETALIIAARQGQLSTVKRLVKHGAAIEAMSQTGATALMIACVFSHTEIVRFLLSEGANPHVGEQFGRETALEMAVRGRGSHTTRKEIVEMLLAQGVDVNYRNTTTAVLMAAYCGDLEMVRLLWEQGADLGVRDKDGYDIVYWASCNPDPQILALIRSLWTGEDTGGKPNITNESQ